VQWYTEAPAPAATDWLSAAHAALGSNSVGGYVNYLEAGTSASRYFNDNLIRLQAVRARYDPNAVMVSYLG
jgi:hypothetical protein